jgi:hypothetical protein
VKEDVYTKIVVSVEDINCFSLLEIESVLEESERVEVARRVKIVLEVNFSSAYWRTNKVDLDGELEVAE